MTKTNAITALRYLGKSVAERGEDYRDPNAVEGVGCQYFDIEPGPKEDTLEFYPSCIVGQVVSYVSDESIIETVARKFNDAGPTDLDFIFTPLAQQMLDAAQQRQDTGSTWGEAYKAAVDFLGEYYYEEKLGFVRAYDTGFTEWSDEV